MADETKYFRIKNWEKYQHPDCTRTDGPMKWVRFETSILDCDKTAHLRDHDRLTWCLLIALSGRLRNKIKHSRNYVRTRLGLSRSPNLALFEELGLIEVFDASGVQAECVSRLDKTRQDNYCKQQARKQTANSEPEQKLKSEEIITQEKAMVIGRKFPRKAGVLGVLEVHRLSNERFKTLEEWNLFEKAVDFYIESCKDQNSRFTKNFKSFLKDDYWKEFLDEHKANLSTRLVR